MSKTEVGNTLRLLVGDGWLASAPNKTGHYCLGVSVTSAYYTCPCTLLISNFHVSCRPALSWSSMSSFLCCPSLKPLVPPGQRCYDTGQIQTSCRVCILE
jgi:hypothetical protein